MLTSRFLSPHPPPLAAIHAAHGSQQRAACGSVSASVFATLPKFDEFLFYSFVPQLPLPPPPPPPLSTRSCHTNFALTTRFRFIYFTFYASFATCRSAHPSSSFPNVPHLVPLVVVSYNIFLISQRLHQTTSPPNSHTPHHSAYFAHLNAGP